MKFSDSVGLSVCVALSGKKLVPQFTWAMMNLHPPMNSNCRHLNIQGRPTHVARNWLVHLSRLEKSEFTFFIDEDVTAPAHAIRQLVFQMRHHPEAAVITGVYCHKQQPCEPMVFRGNGHSAYWDWKIGEFFEIDGSGMGCTLIRNSVFDDIEKAGLVNHVDYSRYGLSELPQYGLTEVKYPEFFYTEDDASKFLDGVNMATAMTEDLFFYGKLRKLDKWKAYADSSVFAEHWRDNGTFAGLPEMSFPTRRFQADGKKIVDIGCGENPYKTGEGRVLTVDIREEVNPDYRCDVRVLPFGTGSFDIVHSSHVLEHTDRDTVDATLDEWIRILKPEGELRLVLPNIAWAAENIVRGIVDNDVLNVLYGGQSNRMDFHHVGFTPQTLEGMLRARGFTKMNFHLQGYNIMVSATRGVPEIPIEAVSPKEISEAIGVGLSTVKV